MNSQRVVEISRGSYFTIGRNLKLLWDHASHSHNDRSAGSSANPGNIRNQARLYWEKNGLLAKTSSAIEYQMSSRMMNMFKINEVMMMIYTGNMDADYTSL